MVFAEHASRDTRFPPVVRRIELGQLPDEAALRFLCACTWRAAEGAEGAACDRLVARLEGLPLALDCRRRCAACMRRHSIR